MSNNEESAYQDSIDGCEDSAFDSFFLRHEPSAVIDSLEEPDDPRSLVRISDRFSTDSGARLAAHRPTHSFGGAWIEAFGSWGVEAGAAKSLTPVISSPFSLAAIDSGGFYNLKISCTIAWETTNTGNIQQGILARYSNPNNYLVLRWVFAPIAGVVGLAIAKMSNGSFSDLAFEPGTPPSASDRLSFVVRGDRLEGYVNGKPRISATDSFNKQATGVGLWAYNTTEARWRDFEAVIA